MVQFLGWDEISRFTRTSKSVLEPTQPNIRWVPGLFHRGYSGRVVKLTTHFHLVPKLRMSGTIPPFPHVPSWRVEGKV